MHDVLLSLLETFEIALAYHWKESKMNIETYGTICKHIARIKALIRESRDEENT